MHWGGGLVLWEEVSALPQVGVSKDWGYGDTPKIPNWQFQRGTERWTMGFWGSLVADKLNWRRTVVHLGYA